MSHLGKEVLRRILGGEGGPQEVEAAAEHLVACDPCRALAGTVADHLRSKKAPGLAAGGPLQLVLDLIDRERQWAVDYMGRDRGVDRAAAPAEPAQPEGPGEDDEGVPHDRLLRSRARQTQGDSVLGRGRVLREARLPLRRRHEPAPADRSRCRSRPAGEGLDRRGAACGRCPPPWGPGWRSA